MFHVLIACYWRQTWLILFPCYTTYMLHSTHIALNACGRGQEIFYRWDSTNLAPSSVTGRPSSNEAYSNSIAKPLSLRLLDMRAISGMRNSSAHVCLTSRFAFRILSAPTLKSHWSCIKKNWFSSQKLEIFTGLRKTLRCLQHREADCLLHPHAEAHRRGTRSTL